MSSDPAAWPHGTMTRRELLRCGAALAGGTLIGPSPAWAGLQHAATADPVAKMRAEFGAAPIERVTLSDSLMMLSGPGGNVLVLHGPDGTVVVDSFLQPAWSALKQTLAGLSEGPIIALIDTHWHLDHVDNNANFRKAGASIVAHARTRKRMSETRELLGMTFKPAPADALPTQTFEDRHTINANREQMVLGYIAPAHTDTDIYVRYARGDVIHLGDLFFNGMYPFIDAGTGGSIDGMIAGVNSVLLVADRRSRVVPGHGPLGDIAAVTKYRDMLVTVRDRVQKLKASGRKLEEVVADNPTKDLDPTWGKGFMSPQAFVGIVYNTLR